MKKILSFLIISFLTFTLTAHAALRLPQNAPLQPVPEGTGLDASHNINTPQTDSNNALQDQSNQTEATQQQDVQSLQDPTAPPVVSSSEDVAASSGGVYLIWLTVGILGLIGAGVWVYIRFYRDE